MVLYGHLKLVAELDLNTMTRTRKQTNVLLQESASVINSKLLAFCHFEAALPDGQRITNSCKASIVVFSSRDDINHLILKRVDHDFLQNTVTLLCCGDNGVNLVL